METYEGWMLLSGKARNVKRGHLHSAKLLNMTGKVKSITHNI